LLRTELMENVFFCPNLYVYNSHAHASRRGDGGRWGLTFDYISTRLLALHHVLHIMVRIKTDKPSCVGQMTN